MQNGFWMVLCCFLEMMFFLLVLFFRLAGFLVIVVEAPCCCMFLDFVGSLSAFVDNRPYWNRGALYIM